MVLGDAELIIPLRGAAELSVIRDRGSIDTKKAKEIVCTILEDNPKAFCAGRCMDIDPAHAVLN